MEETDKHNIIYTKSVKNVWSTMKKNVHSSTYPTRELFFVFVSHPRRERKTVTTKLLHLFIVCRFKIELAIVVMKNRR